MRVNKIKLITIPLVLLLIIFLTVLFSETSKPKKIAFYGIPENLQNSITKTISDNIDIVFSTVALDPSLPLFTQQKALSDCALVIYDYTPESNDFLNVTAKPVEDSFTEGFPSTIKNTVITQSINSEIKVLPFLYDFYEIDVNTALFNQTGRKTLTVWNDMVEIAYLEKHFTTAPLLLPLASDSEFLNCFGMIAESLCGYENYEKLLSEILQNKENDKEFAEMMKKITEEENYLGKAIAEVDSMLKSGIMPRDTLRFTPADILFYMNNELSGIHFTTLSQHRKLSKEAANHYTSIYCPSLEFTPDRKFAADQISVSLLQNKKFAKEILKDLTDTWQSELCTVTGLSPVQKNCDVPDHQADDVRFWLAASKGPAIPLAKAFKSDDQRKNAADYLRGILLEE